MGPTVHTDNENKERGTTSEQYHQTDFQLTASDLANLDICNTDLTILRSGRIDRKYVRQFPISKNHEKMLFESLLTELSLVK